MDKIAKEAAARHERHLRHPTHRPLSEDYELKGLRGEEALSRTFGCSVDLTPRPGGDGGKDAVVSFYDDDDREHQVRIDIKTAERPLNLIVEKGKVKPTTIYILARWDVGAQDVTELLGWEWGITLLAAPLKDFGYGVVNHYIPRNKLRSIDELLQRRSPMGIKIEALRVGPPYPVGTRTTIKCDGCGFEVVDIGPYTEVRARRTAIGWLERQSETKGRQFLCPNCKE